MRRRLFNLAATVSLALCAASVVLWVRSYAAWDELHRDYNSPDLYTSDVLEHAKGRIICDRYIDQEAHVARSQQSSQAGFKWWYRRNMPDDLRPGGLGFDVWSNFIHYGGDSEGRRGFMVPHWALVLLFGIPPATALGMRWRRRLAARIGMCPTCGYDLRATPDRCPECGTAVTRPPRAAEAV